MTHRIILDRVGRDVRGEIDYNESANQRVAHVWEGLKPRRLFMVDPRPNVLGYYVISEPIHDWLLQRDLFYESNVALGFVYDSGSGPGSGLLKGNFVLDFVNLDHALMFKLTWCGR
jgi:hypothetical protein